jgi:hypothetical protein
MKVYVVTIGMTYNWYIHSIWTTEEAAIKCAKEVELEGQWSHVDVHELQDS